jgi:hypothetical protein
MFKAVPNGGEVVICNGEVVGLKRDAADPAWNTQFSVRLDGEAIHIDSRHIGAQKFMLTIFDLYGRMIVRCPLNDVHSRIALPVRKMFGSMIIVKITNGNTVFIRQIRQI